MSKSERIKTLVAVIALMVLVYVAYLPEVSRLQYVWDDWELFINSPTLRTPSLVLEGLVTPILPGTTYFRPLPLATFALEFITHGVSPDVSHVINLTLHAVNVLMVFQIAKALADAAGLHKANIRAICAATLYALHPALIEPVTWVAGRFDLLVTLFYLAAVLCYLKLDGRKRVAAIIAAFSCAALSKEMAATMPIIFVLLWSIKIPNGTSLFAMIKTLWSSQEKWMLLGMLLAGFVYLGFRQYFMGQITHADRSVTASLGVGLGATAFIGQTLLFYIKMVIWPFASINPQHPFNPALMTGDQLVIGVLVLIVAVSLTWFCFTRRTVAGITFLCALVSLLPVLNIVPLTIGGNIGHERFLVLPLAFFSIAACMMVRPAQLKISNATRRILPLGLLLALSSWILVSFANIRVTVPLWQSDLTLWAWAYEKNPDFAFAKFSYAAAAVRYNRYALAEKILEQKNTDEAGNFPLKILRANVKLRTGHPREAATMLEEAGAHRMFPHQILDAHSIPVTQAKIKGGGGSRWLFQYYFTSLAEAYVSSREFGKAKVNAEVAIFYSPRYPPAWLMRSFSEYGLGDRENADHSFDQAMEYFAPSGKIDAIRLRGDFLSQYCGVAGASRATCDQVTVSLKQLSDR